VASLTLAGVVIESVALCDDGVAGWRVAELLSAGATLRAMANAVVAAARSRGATLRDFFVVAYGEREVVLAVAAGGSAPGIVLRTTPWGASEPGASGGAVAALSALARLALREQPRGFVGLRLGALALPRPALLCAPLEPPAAALAPDAADDDGDTAAALGATGSDRVDGFTALAASAALAAAAIAAVACLPSAAAARCTAPCPVVLLPPEGLVRRAASSVAGAGPAALGVLALASTCGLVRLDDGVTEAEPLLRDGALQLLGGPLDFDGLVANAVLPLASELPVAVGSGHIQVTVSKCASAAAAAPPPAQGDHVSAATVPASAAIAGATKLCPWELHLADVGRIALRHGGAEAGVRAGAPGRRVRCIRSRRHRCCRGDAGGGAAQGGRRRRLAGDCHRRGRRVAAADLRCIAG